MNCLPKDLLFLARTQELSTYRIETFAREPIDLTQVSRGFALCYLT